MFLTKRRRKSELAFGEVKMNSSLFFFFLWLLLEFAAIDVEEERAFLIWSLPFVLFQQNIHREVQH